MKRFLSPDMPRCRRQACVSARGWYFAAEMEPAARLKAFLRSACRVAVHPIASCSYLLLAILPLLVAGRYNYPSNDDYDNVIWTNFWGFQQHIYLRFGGRFFSNLVVALDPIRWHSLTGYRIAAALLILSFAATYTLTICRMLRRFTAQPFSNRLFAGAAATFIIFNGMASLSQGFFWYTGSMTYTLPAILLCWAALIGFRLDAGTGRVPAVPAIAQALLMIAAVGCNETGIVIPGALSVFLTMHYRSGRPRLSRWYRALTGIWLVAAMVAVLAPGNFMRQAGEPRNILITMPTWLFVSKDLFLEWISEPVFLAFSTGFLMLMMRHPVRIRLRTLAAFLTSLVLIALVLFPSFWALSRMPPFRVINLCFMVFVPAWLITLMAAARALTRFATDHAPLWLYLRGALAISMTLLLLNVFRVETLRASSNYVLVAKDFGKGILTAYDASQRERLEIIRQSGDTVHLPRLQHTQGNVVFFADLGENPDVFPNRSVAAYWGKKRIVLQPRDTARRQAGVR